MNTETQKMIAQAFGKLDIEMIDTKEILNERLGKLEYTELQALMRANCCELKDLTARVWAHMTRQWR